MPGRYNVYRSPTLSVDFEMDRKGIAKVAIGKELRREVNRIAVAALPYAVQVSHKRTGAYSKSWGVNRGGTTIVAAMRRVVARLVNDDEAAAAIEWGADRDGYRIPAQHIMRKVLEHISEGHVSDVA